MQLVEPESIDLATLPSIELTERKQLPNIAACYLVMEKESVIYIGKSTNLVIRWLSHNRLKEIKLRGTDIKIAWIEVSDPNLLLVIEKALIQYFKPPLNRNLTKTLEPKKLPKPKKLLKLKKLSEPKKLICKVPKSRGNQNPNYTSRFQKVGDETLSRKTVGVRLTVEMDAMVRLVAGDDLGGWLRRVITEAVKNELQKSA